MGLSHETRRVPKTIVAWFRTAVMRRPEGDAPRYFDGDFTYALNRDSDALAAALQDHGSNATFRQRPVELGRARIRCRGSGSQTQKQSL